MIGSIREQYAPYSLSVRRFCSLPEGGRVLGSKTLAYLLRLGCVAIFLLPIAAANTPQRTYNLHDPVPIMAYYYIWFDVPSWNRAKSDYPLLGRYSSDEQEVMEQHVRWAKEAGIDGFIVSWKSSYKLDKRLEQLLDIAAAHDFYIWIIYQGLDFDRNPLPVDQIDSDLEFFVRRYAQHDALRMYDRPLVIWSGTWEFSPQEILSVTRSYREQLYILASERNLRGYERLLGAVDGNAYYWSSVNPATFPGYQEKLNSMGALVRQHGGLWIAPAAPGFDARLLGGHTVVERHDGETLRQQLNAALRSSPTAIGLISWNEFSENSHIEPSQRYGTRALEVLADREITFVPEIREFDSSAPGTTARDDVYGFFVLAGLGSLIVGSFAVIIARNRQVVLQK